MAVSNALEVFKRLEIPAATRQDSVQLAEGQFLYDWVREKSLSRTLEIGLAHGASAAAILAAHSGTHTCMDPFQEQDYQNLGLRNLASLGFSDRLRFYPHFSHDALPRLLSQNEAFDFAFIDGAHLYDAICLDFYYVDKMLSQDGYVLFHDNWMRTTQMVVSFIRHNRKDYRQIRCPVRNVTMFQKTGCDERPWHHFREFYTFKAFLTHRAVVWMLNRGILNRFLGH